MGDVTYEAGPDNQRPAAQLSESLRAAGIKLRRFKTGTPVSYTHLDVYKRQAQDFSMRYPLVDGHGNFGSVDGDPPAAYRYTEAKMSKISTVMLTDIDKETVDFGSNYDDRLKEPSVLPSRFPNILVNGSTGIAVGMATNIPPHNLGEVIDAVDLLLDHPDAGLDEIMTCIQGPDFPTGGIIMGRSGIRAAYGLSLIHI